LKKVKSKDPVTENDLALFCEVSTSIHSARDLDTMLQRIFRTIKRVFQVEGASLALHEPDQKEFYFIRTVENARKGVHKGIQKMRFPDHQGIAGWVLRENRPVIIPDVSKDSRHFQGIEIKKDFVARSMICCPLRTRQGTIGILYALNKLSGEFIEKDKKLLEILSDTIAIAIENAQLYGELKQYTGFLAKENRQLKSEAKSLFNLQGVIGYSEEMQRVFSLIEKVMETSTTVLIQGETGTGKELIARVIHYNGPRKKAPLVMENCGALSENLLESELFGHVKGAFTDAVRDKKGLFEMADGGTVFLDEIGEMSTAMQVKLLRVIQEGQIRPVGGNKSREVDVRLITATNRNLEEEVKKGRFRKDLFYRIHVFPITIPPLRERREDIPLLAVHFLEKLSTKKTGTHPQLTSQTLNFLCRYDWPGNVRELENEIERAFTLCRKGKSLTPDCLSEKIHAFPEKLLSILNTEGTLHEVVEQIEQRMILDALQKSAGNRSQAARQLGLTRQGLLNKIVRYDINL